MRGWGGRAMSAGRTYPRGLGNGFRARRVQTAEGELWVDIRTSERRPSRLCPRSFPLGTKLLWTEPLRAMVIGASCAGCRCATSSH
jgi:hypothetical protein